MTHAPLIITRGIFRAILVIWINTTLRGIGIRTGDRTKKRTRTGTGKEAKGGTGTVTEAGVGTGAWTRAVNEAGALAR